MQFALDLHNHTRFSRDSRLDPLSVIRLARKRGLQGIAVTDHGTIRGGVEMRDENPFKDFLVIVGTEIHTEIGDVIGLFLEQEIQSTSFDGIAREIHGQGGLVLLPHPGKMSIELVKPWLRHIDLVEVWNARSKITWNTAAAALAEQARKPTVACSDAHCGFEIARAYTILSTEGMHSVRNDLLTAPRSFVRRSTNFYVSHIASSLTERWKILF